MSSQSSPISTAHSGARCALHPEQPAVDICSRCGSYACVLCRHTGHDGLGYCGKCNPQTYELAEIGTRFLANLVDSLAWAIPVLGAAVLGELLGDGLRELFLGLAGLWTIGILIYQLYLASSGQSIGKKILNIRVVRSDYSPVSLGRILFLRNLVPGVIGSLCGLFNLIDALFIFGEQRRCIHDMIADTLVVKVGS
jgi:uncharacterized RDD family membrane protein YckC